MPRINILTNLTSAPPATSVVPSVPNRVDTELPPVPSIHQVVESAPPTQCDIQGVCRQEEPTVLATEAAIAIEGSAGSEYVKGGAEGAAERASAIDDEVKRLRKQIVLDTLQELQSLGLSGKSISGEFYKRYMLDSSQDCLAAFAQHISKPDDVDRIATQINNRLKPRLSVCDFSPKFVPEVFYRHNRDLAKLFLTAHVFALIASRSTIFVVGLNPVSLSLVRSACEAFRKSVGEPVPFISFMRVRHERYQQLIDTHYEVLCRVITE